METNSKRIARRKLEIMNIVKKFREGIASYSHEITEKYENLANDENENDIDYLIECLRCLENLFHSVAAKYNIDYTPEKSIELHSTFIETPKWISNLNCTINPQNNDNKCF